MIINFDMMAISTDGVATGPQRVNKQLTEYNICTVKYKQHT